MAAWAMGRGIGQGWQEVCQWTNVRPKAAQGRRKHRLPGCLPSGFPSASRRSQSSVFPFGHQRAAAPSQWLGGRGRLQRRERLPPLLSHPRPRPRPRPGAHTCEGHTKARDARRTVAQTKAFWRLLPLSSSPRPGSGATKPPGASK